MSTLTEQMAELRDEILALRSGRQGLARTLRRETEERRADVSQTLADFSKTLTASARRTKADRLASLSELKRTVDGLRTDVHTDLSRIRQTWRGLSSPSRRAEEKVAIQTTRETEPTPEESEIETGIKVPPAFGGGEKPVRKKRKH